MTPRNAATAAATAFVDELCRGGVREVVLAPGSRSAPLAFAVHEAASAGRLRLHVRIDERSAGFLALGLVRTSRRPVAVVTTSGTAVANLHPAVLEASHAGLPLVVLSADRPAGLRGTGANQTTDQVKLFGDTVRAFADVPAGSPGRNEAAQVAGWRSLAARSLITAAGTGGRPGPVHVNLQLAEPLVPDMSDRWSTAVLGRPDGGAWTQAPEHSTPTPEPVAAEERTVVVAGDDAGPAARLLAESAGWPLLAEPTSGARTGPNAIRAYRLLLADDELAGRVRQVVVYGHPTLSRPVTRLLSRDDVEVVAVTGPAGWTDPGHRVSRVVRAAHREDLPPGAEWRVAAAAEDGGAPSSRWLEEWRARDRELSRRIDEHVAAQPGLTPHEVAGAVAAALPPRGLLFVGASNPVRDLDVMASPYPVGERRLVVANRGLSGIDGSVSSAVGAALGRAGGSSRALALLGDLTLLHDANGLVIGPDEPRPDLTVVVVNDDGGSIFSVLEQGGAPYASSFERIFGTPHGVDLAALCAASSTPHRRVTDIAGLAQALGSPRGGIEVVEAVVRRDNRRDLDAAIRGLATGH